MSAGRTRLALVAILILAAAVRIMGLDWGLPYSFNSDEHLMFTHTERLRSVRPLSTVLGNPEFFIYPPLLMHALIAVTWVASFVRDVAPNDPASISSYYLMGRSISAMFGVGTVGVAYVLGQRAYGTTAGLLAALFVALSVLHVRDSHFFTTDVAFTCALLLLVTSALTIAQGTGTRGYLIAGIIAGLGVVTKQTTLLALPLLPLAHLIALRAQHPSRPRAWYPLLVLAAAFVITVVIADPYPLLSPGPFLYQSKVVAGYVGGVEQRHWTFQFTDTNVLYWFTNLLRFGLGWPLELLGLAGIGWALYRRQPADVLLLTFFALYMALVGTGFMKFVRYAVPLVPILAILGARAAAEAMTSGRAPVRRLAWLLAALVVASAGFHTFAYLRVFRTPDARVQASRWIHDQVPPGTTVVVDNSYTTPLLGSRFQSPEFFTRYNVLCTTDDCVVHDHFRIKVLNMVNYRSGSLHDERLFSEYVAERLSDADYLVMGDEFEEQYRRRASDYPHVVELYRQLDEDLTAFRLVQEFKTRPSFLGVTWNDDASELTFRLFDHPRVRVFRRASVSGS